MKNPILAIIAVSLFTPVLAQAKPVIGVATFKLAANVKIHAANDSTARLADLRIGERVAISYQDNNGILIAEKIHEVVLPNADDGTGKTETPVPKAKADTDLHAHGVITAIDSSAQTFTADIRVARVKR